MRFEWDPEKARINLAKHRVSFDLAARLWDDPLHAFFLERVEDGERRWHVVGRVGNETVLVVVHSYPDDLDDERIRIISARRATPKERRRYEQEAF